MRGKILIVSVIGVAMLVASASFANVPAPPVNQQLGIDDSVFNNLTEAECRACHGVVADRHHMLYGAAIPQGACSTMNGTCSLSGDPCAKDANCPAGETCVAGTPRTCIINGDCAVPVDVCNITGDNCSVGSCSVSGGACTYDSDCPAGETCAGECPSEHTGQFCGQPFCYGGSAIPEADANNDGASDTNYGCLNCHEQSIVGGVIQFIVTRDCTQCHHQNPNTPTVHHASETGDAKNGICTSCHGDLVDDKDDGHYIPTYAPSLVTPEPVAHVCSVSETSCADDADCPAGETCELVEDVPGGCTYCHDPGTDTVSGVAVVSNHDTHHGAGVHKNQLGGSVSAICAWCHKAGNPHNAGGEDVDRIRTCENCHGPGSLHNVQADSDASGDIVVGGELPGYGHIGADDPTGSSDCWGCHGFSTASAPDTGPIVPSISSADVSTMVAGTDAVVTLTGSAFTNLVGTFQWTSDVVMTAADGSSTTLTPDSISQGSLTVTIPGTTVPGNYTLQAVKGDVSSNPVVLSVTPQVVIGDVDCSKCLGTMTITGSGFSEKPAGTDEDINVTEGGRTLNVISWTDTQIKASGARCRGTVTVDALFGSAQQ